MFRVLLRPVPAAAPGRSEGPRSADPLHVLRQPDLAQQLHQPAALRSDEPPVPPVLPAAAHQGLLAPGPSLEGPEEQVGLLLVLRVCRLTLHEALTTDR